MLLRGAARPSADGVLAVLAANAFLAVVVIAVGPLVPLLLMAVVAATVKILQRPQHGILILAALAPFDGLLELAPPLPFVNVWSEALVVLVCGATFVAPAATRGAPGRKLPPWVPAVVALLALGLVSGVVVGGLRGLVGVKVTFFYVLAAVAVWRCPLTPKERDRLVTILIATGAVTSAYGLLQQLMGPDALNALGYEYNTTIRFAGSWLRSFSTFNQPFGFGLYVMLVVLVAMPHALAQRRRLRSQIFFLLLPLFGLAILSTIVRASWLGLAAGLAFIGSTRSRLLLFVVPAALVVVLVLPEDARTSALSTSSSEERVEGWSESVDRLIEHPLGVGIGSTGSAAEKVSELTDNSDIYQPDNYYFKLVYELGALGLWLLVLLLISTFSTARRIAESSRGLDAAFARGVAASILAAAVASFVATYFEIFPLDLLFWVLLAVTATTPAPADHAAVARPGLLPVS